MGDRCIKARGTVASWLVHWIQDHAVWSSSSGQGHCIVYKWVPTNLMLRWTSIPSSRLEETLLVALCYGNWDTL